MLREAGRTDRREPAAPTRPASSRLVPTVGSPRPGTGTRRRAAPGSRVGARTSCPAWRSWPAAGARSAGSRTRAAAPRRGRGGPTTRIDEFAMTRRSTSLAVCCAPMRMIPSERPRSATSSRISLIGESPSRGAYLLSSSSTTNSSGRAEPDCFLLVERRANRDADDEALGAVVQVVEVDDRDLARRRCAPGGRRAAATSARMRWPSGRCDEQQPADERVARCPMPVAAPAQSRASASSLDRSRR